MEPITRKEMYLAAAAGQEVALPEPITREEKFLYKIAMRGGGGVSSWNDLTDKPFYSEPVEVLPETTVEIDPDMGIGMLPDLAIIADDECTIKYNGTDYVCKCVDNGQTLALGNFGMLDEENPVDTGEPFVIATVDVGDGNIAWAIVPLDGSASVTLSIIGQAHHPVPDKYLPTFGNANIFDISATGNSSGTSNLVSFEGYTAADVYKLVNLPNTIVRIFYKSGGHYAYVFNLEETRSNEKCVTFSYFDASGDNTPYVFKRRVVISEVNGTMLAHHYEVKVYL